MPSALEELTSTSAILAAAHYRNKNQHRLAKWWKQFCVFRRNLSRLIREMEELNSCGEVKRVDDIKLEASRVVVEKRVDFMMQWVVPKCYVAFTSVVADTQFANLGLMLVGSLARVRRVMEPFASKVVEEPVEASNTTPGIEEGDDEFDFGVVVSREDFGVKVAREPVDDIRVKKWGDSESEVEEKPKKSKRSKILEMERASDPTSENEEKPSKKSKKRLLGVERVDEPDSEPEDKSKKKKKKLSGTDIVKKSATASVKKRRKEGRSKHLP